MSWQEVVAVTVVLLGLGAGAFLVARRPSFCIEFGSRVAKVLLSLAWRYVSKRLPPEEKAAWREAERRGQGDEWRRKWTRSTLILTGLAGCRSPLVMTCKPLPPP